MAPDFQRDYVGYLVRTMKEADHDTSVAYQAAAPCTANSHSHKGLSHRSPNPNGVSVLVGLFAQPPALASA
jgi:hypothetical protein